MQLIKSFDRSPGRRDATYLTLSFSGRRPSKFFLPFNILTLSILFEFTTFLFQQDSSHRRLVGYPADDEEGRTNNKTFHNFQQHAPCYIFSQRIIIFCTTRFFSHWWDVMMVNWLRSAARVPARHSVYNMGYITVDWWLDPCALRPFTPVVVVCYYWPCSVHPTEFQC